MSTSDGTLIGPLRDTDNGVFSSGDRFSEQRWLGGLRVDGGLR